MGLSLDEFCKFDYDEFESVSKAWREMTEAQNRASWERMRILALITIQPHIKNKLTPHSLLPFPWDNKGHSRHHEKPILTPEEEEERFKEVARRLGDQVD